MSAFLRLVSDRKICGRNCSSDHTCKTIQAQSFNQVEVDLFELLCKVLDHNLFAQVDWARNSYYFKELKVRQKVPYRLLNYPNPLMARWSVSKQCKKWFLENNWGLKTYSHHHWLYHFTWSENHVDGNSFLLVVIKFIGMFALLICCRVHIFTVWKQLWTLKQSANCGKKSTKRLPTLPLKP